MNTQKYCTKCGEELLPNNKFCVSCGAEIKSPEKNFSVKNKTNNKNKGYKNLIMAIALIVVFLIVIAVFAYPSQNNNQKNTEEQLLPTTNPAYLVSPESFVIDEENIISNLPDDDKSVWVEEVMNENTIKVSYIILKGGKNIITFAVVNLYGIGSTKSECFKRETINFLKKFIEHKYVYLSSRGVPTTFRKNPDFYNFEKENPNLSKKLLLKYVKIWKEDVDIPEVIKLHDDKTGKDEIEVNVTLMQLGYAMPFINIFNNIGYSMYDSKIKFDDALEIARVTKKGLWGEVCNGDE